jgi:histidinol dehydrogenase (EC 1.1.1.23)
MESSLGCRRAAQRDQAADGAVVEAALEAAKSLERVYARLRPADVVDYYEGVLRAVSWRPVERAALYVPARYISTLVMLAVPARAAGVGEIYVVTPPRGVTPELLTVAERLGVRGVVSLGGPSRPGVRGLPDRRRPVGRPGRSLRPGG